MPIMQNFPTFYTTNKKSEQKPQTYGLLYLSQAANTMMSELIALYDQCEILTVDTALSPKQVHAEQVQAALTAAQATGDLTKFRNVIRAHTKEVRAANAFQWYKAWNQSLQKKSFWQQMERAIDNSLVLQRNQLATLRANWKLHGKFSHYSLDALLYAAHVLDLMEEHLQAAYAEYKKRSPKMIAEHQSAYNTYLGQSLNAIKQERRRIMAAIMVRLQLMRESQDLTYTDITVHTIKQLKTLGALKPETPIDHQPLSTPFNAKLFLGCHRYITEKSGATSLCRFFNIEQPDKAIPLVGKSCATQYVLAPAHLAPLIPTRPARLPWFSKGHQLRYQFFKDKVPLLLTLSFLSGATIKVANRLYLLENPLWRTLKEAQQQLEAALKAVQKQQITGWQSRFYQKTNDFLTKWQETLREQQQMVIKHQLELLEKWVAVPPAEHLFKKSVFSSEVHQEINAVLDQLERIVKVSQPEHQRLKVVRQHLTAVLQTDKQYHALKVKAPKILEQLAQGNPVASDDSIQLLDYYAELNPEEQAQFEREHQINFNIIRRAISVILSETPDKLIHTAHYSATLLWLSQCGQFLRKFKQAGSQESFNEVLSKTLTRYMNYLKQSKQRLNEAEEQKQLIAYEAVLEQLATLDQIERLAAAQIFRQTINQPNIIISKKEITSSVVEQVEVSLQQDVANRSLTEERKIFKERCLQNQRHTQEMQQCDLEIGKINIDMRDTLDACEEDKKQCDQLFFQNDKLLQIFNAKPPIIGIKLGHQEGKVGTIAEETQRKSSQLQPNTLRY